MFFICLLFLNVYSALVEYRFGINFGKRFWDYSGNNRHSYNELGTIKSTDRGAYLGSIDCQIETPASMALPTPHSYLEWIMPTNSESRLIYRTYDPSIRYHLGRNQSLNAIYIYVDYQGNGEITGPSGSFPSGAWSLVALTYNGSTFKAYVNGNQIVSLNHAFSTASTGFNTGLGTRNTAFAKAVIGFVWKFIIISGIPDYSNLISGSASNCIIPGVCSTCSVSIIDESLGTGCLPTNMDISKNSNGITCADTSTGCSETTIYSCSSTTIACIYDRVSNNCYLKSTTLPYTETQVACSCQTGYSSTNNQCCRSDCSYCDKTGFCISCKSLNSYISSGVCHCSTNYYGTLPLTNVDSCCLKGSGCSVCSLTNPCTACVDSNAFISGTSCLCNYGYYQSGTNTCSACNFGCKTCVNGDLCTSCWDLKMSEISSNVCECQFGYYASSAMTCSPCNNGCKQCSSSDPCTLCWDVMMKEVNNVCSCNDGYYDGPSNNCIACGQGCKKCNSSDSCLECWDLLMIEKNNICSCQDGYYDGPSNNCLACGLGCKSCSYNFACISCFDSNSVNNGEKCICDQGFYEVNSTFCGACGVGCKTCSSNSCLTCFDSSATITGTSCVCSPGFYLDSLNFCTACGRNCETCSSTNQCITCFDMNAISTGDYCKCNDGFYDIASDNFCHPCENSCRVCEKTYCLECISINTKIDENKCVCKTGFWSENEPIEENSCQMCFEECETCNKQYNCLTCKSKNASPSKSGCKCDDGFWNETRLIENNSCNKCAPTCQTCTEQNICTSCSHPLSELNKKGECLILCWKNQVESCINCSNLCLTCNPDLICLTCSKNSLLKNGHCTCLKGYKEINKTCTEQYFYANLTTLNKNSLNLSFNEPLSSILSDSDISLEINKNSFKFYLKKLNHSEYRVTFLGLPEVNYNFSFKLTILKKLVYSKGNSMLFNHVFLGNIEFNIISVNFIAAAAKPLGQTFTTVSFGAGMMSNPAGLWSLLNTIQLITFMPINSVPYSKKLTEASSSLMNYNIIPNVLKYISNSDATSHPHVEAEEFGITTTVLLLNCGPICVIFIQCLVVSVFFILLSKCFRNSIKIQNYKEKFKFNLLIRFWIQAYLELAIFGFIQAKAQILIQVEGYLYVCLGFLVSFFVVISPFVLFVTMKNSSESRHNQEFLISFGSLYDEFLNDRGVYSTLYYPLFLLRRLAYSIVQIFLNSYPAYQAYLNVAATVLVIIYLFYFRPFKDRLVLASTIIGEICILIVFTVSSFFMYTDDQFHIKKIENICIYTVLGTMGMQFLINMLMFFSTLKKLWAKMMEERALRIIKSGNQMFSQEKIIRIK